MAIPSPLYALVVEGRCRPTKSPGRFFWQVTLRTVHGDIKALMWDAPGEGCEENPAFPHVKDILAITEFKDELQEYGSIKINTGGFARIQKEDIPEDQRNIAEPPKASPEEMDKAYKTITDPNIWENKHHHQFVMNCLNKYDPEKLRQSPAATGVHHNYIGGWMVHTAEVLQLVKAVLIITSNKYSFVNKDVLYASAILHDIGKVDTYRINELEIAESLPIEKTVGHMFYAMNVAKSVADEMEEVSDQFTEEVLHCIASHHGLLEWGSYKEVQSIEAGILSRMDYISSRNGMMEKKLKECNERGQALEPTFRMYGDMYFTTLGMQKYVESI